MKKLLPQANTLATVIRTFKLIGQLFAKTALYPKRKAVRDGKEIVRSLYPEYGEAVIDRRTKCLIGWCEEIIDYMRASDL